jgi:hypothetical protein
MNMTACFFFYLLRFWCIKIVYHVLTPSISSLTPFSKIHKVSPPNLPSDKPDLVPSSNVLSILLRSLTSIYHLQHQLVYPPPYTKISNNLRLFA